MYEFVDRLVNIALPRVRDFRGLNPKSFDGRGNYAIGIKEHIVFPEIDYDKAEQVWGMDIVICTTARYRRRGARAAFGIEFPVPAVRFRSSDADNQETLMAKKSSIEKNERAPQDDQELCRPPLASSRRSRATRRCRWRTASLRRSSLRELPRNSSPTRHPQPLRSHRPTARVLSQAQDEPHRAAGTRVEGPDSRPREVELVRRDRRNGAERSARRYAHPHPQRADAEQVEGVDAGLQAARERARSAQEARATSGATRRPSSATVAPSSTSS